jgi:hypothetical protein
MTKRRNLFEELKEGIAHLAATRQGAPAELDSVASLTQITNDTEYAQATTVLNWLLDAGGADENNLVAPLVDSVGGLIADYETRQK